MRQVSIRVKLTVAAASLALLFAHEMAAQAATAGYALIYNGKAAAEGGPEAVAAVARDIGLEVKFLSDPDRLPEMLPGAAVFVIGGTEDDLSPLIKAFTPKILGALKDWLSAGGRYWGICGGGYLASEGWEDTDGFVKAFGLVPAVSMAYIENPDPRIISVIWQGKERAMYYQYGPSFAPDKASGTEVVASYDDGTIAALAARFGKGKVAVVGPHPEADDSWLDDDPRPKNSDKWTSSADLAQAMLRDLLAP